jgi:hypothetical protein
MDNSTFLSQVISSPDFHIPLEANFVVGIDNIQKIVGNLNSNIDVICDSNLNIYENVWGQISNDDMYFANGVKIPGEGSNSNRVGIDNPTVGGLLSGPTLRGRKALTNFEISFLETNTSFIDFVIRPWIVAGSQFGLYARKLESAGSVITSNQDFRTNVTITFLSKAGQTKNTQLQVRGRTGGIQYSSVDPEHRKTITFFNAAPVDLQSYDAAYGNSKTNMRVSAVAWTYSNYEIKSLAIENQTEQKRRSVGFTQ